MLQPTATTTLSHSDYLKYYSKENDAGPHVWCTRCSKLTVMKKQCRNTAEIPLCQGKLTENKPVQISSVNACQE